MPMRGSPVPWSYFFIRLLFKFVLKIFYGTIVVEGADLIPRAGEPCIVCANHSNCLTDALLLVSAVPSKTRGMLRLTAASKQFGKRSFTSWLIESAGTLPIYRKKDFVDPDGTPDNTPILVKLMEALEIGDAVCLFPEGASRYHPSIAPLKTGVARLCSDVLSRNRDNPDFEVSILTCSITYMHRQHFRSDVLVTFHEPLRFKPSTHPELLGPVDYSEIRNVTAQMHTQISAGTLDSPSWDLVRAAKLAAGMYAPLGTRVSLGDYVRLVRTFLAAFKLSAHAHQGSGGSADEAERAELRRQDQEVAELLVDLRAYQEQLTRLQLKDDRVRRPLSRHTLIRRMLVRLVWALILFALSLPGLCLWLPVFLTTYVAVRNFKKTGPIWDTWDEIAQYKLVYGLGSGLAVWGLCILLTLPFAPLSGPLVPFGMWLALRWLEDGLSSFRAFAALGRMLRAGPARLAALHTTREALHARVVALAVGTLGLPEDAEAWSAGAEDGGRAQRKGRTRGKWESRARYFSVKRRRKKDWNETLRLYEVDYPEEDG